VGNDVERKTDLRLIVRGVMRKRGL
jgi:hypothetical protein